MCVRACVKEDFISLDNAIAFVQTELKTNHFLARQTEFGRIFSSTTIVTQIYSKQHMKDTETCLPIYTHTPTAKFRNECVICLS